MSLGFATIAWCGPAMAAAPFDGSTPLLCALNDAMECVPGGACERLQLDEVGAPPFFRIDVASRSVIPVTSAPGDQRKSEIRNTGEIDGKLILQGFEDGIENVRDGLGWSMAITIDTGHFVLSASGDRVAFVVFGACTTIGSGSQ